MAVVMFGGAAGGGVSYLVLWLDSVRSAPRVLSDFWPETECDRSMYLGAMSTLAVLPSCNLRMAITSWAPAIVAIWYLVAKHRPRDAESASLSTIGTRGSSLLDKRTV